MNQREIKFRIWDADDKKMYRTPVEIKKYAETQQENAYNIITRGFGGIHVMQFTGLRDRNNVEIYEGDLLEFKRDPKGIVDLWPHQLGVREVKYPFLCGNADEGEIIGNVWENPELLSSV